MGSTMLIRILAFLPVLLLAAAPAFAQVNIPIPEPASLTVLAVGAGAVIAARFWRK